MHMGLNYFPLRMIHVRKLLGKIVRGKKNDAVI
jgi:hypothetical protein